MEVQDEAFIYQDIIKLQKDIKIKNIDCPYYLLGEVSVPQYEQVRKRSCKQGKRMAKRTGNEIEVEDPNSQLATSIRKMITDFSPLSPNCCIFRAPNRVRQLNEKAFDPMMVSIGPFHHGKEELQYMEKHKIAYLDAFLSRSNLSLETCIKVVKEWENRVRNCYAETIEFSSDDFVKMILLDSCFAIEVIWRYNYVNHREEPLDRLSQIRILSDSRLDMSLLENQLPFFVLEGLFNLAFPESIGTDECFVNLCIEYLSFIFLSGEDASELAKRNITRQHPLDIKHLLDLLRMCQAPSVPRQIPEDSPQGHTMWRAVELEEAGMVIKSGLNYNNSATDIRYTKGVLEIPKLKVNGLSERVLRNLIALESHLYSHNSYISHYIHFMDSLIDTSKDVELLIRNGIIDIFSSDSHEVAALFNNLRPYCHLPTYFYYGIQEKVNAYCKVPWHKWRATLRRDYFSSPWIIASTTAAMILLIFTLIQTVYSII